MRNLLNLSVLGAVYLQVSLCTPRCLIYDGRIADCSHRSLSQVPVLPQYITHIYISFNYIRELNEDSFLALEGLQELDLGWQYVSGLVIRDNTFRRLGNLTVLYLGNNKGLQIEPDAFVGLSNLRKLSLFTCDLRESVLEGDYLRPLLSLETLDLYGNTVKRIRPALFFQNMTGFRELNISLNQMDSVCEADLVGFQGKHFELLKMDSTDLSRMTQYGFDWERCGNPFRNMSMGTLDLTSNGFTVDKARLFFKAIEGTKIDHLILASNAMGKSFSFSNSKDPDKQTFQGLKNSAVKTLDVSKCFIFALQNAVFSLLREAKEITLAYNSINKIDQKAFLGLENVQKLNLSYNLIGEIRRDAFLNLPNILVLDLSYNHIGVLGYQAFTGLSSLLALDLTGNSIRKLGTLAPLPNLQVIHLDDNKLTSLSGLTGFASNSIIIKVQTNRLSNFMDLYTILTKFHKVEYVWFGENLITKCTLNRNISILPQNSLKLLDLSGSYLQLIWAQGICLDVFDNLSQLISLSLHSNSLQSLPEGIFNGLTSLVEMDLSFNSLTYLQPNIFPVSLTTVDLSYNFLATPDPRTFRFLRTVGLSKNLFHCDCDLLPFLMWLNGTNVAFSSNVEEFRCEFPSELHGVRLSNYSTALCEEDDEGLMLEVRLSIFITCSTLLILVTISTIVFIRLRGYLFTAYRKVMVRVLEGPKREPPPGGDVKYDAYLCFSNNDYRWVEAALLKRLDSQLAERNVLRCCFEARDFLPGEDHLANIRDAVWGSRKTVCVVSKEFLKDGWCLEAFSLAQSRMLEELKDLLILVVVGKMPPYRLMKYKPIRSFIQKKEYLQWPEDSQDLEWFYDKLTWKIVKDRTVKKRSDPNLNPNPNPGPDIELEII